MAKELLHFQRAVSPHSVITGRNCHLNWQIKQRMNGTNAEPLVPQHYRFKDREISSHTERGEEIRGSGDMETDISVSSSIHPLVLLSPSSSPLPSPFSSSLPSSFFPLRWILVLDLRSLPTLSLCLFPLAFSLPALLPWLQHHPLHEVHLCSWDGSKRIGGSQDRLVIHDMLWGHHGNAPHLMIHLRREHSIHRHLGCRHRKSHWCWSHLRNGHGCRCHGMGGVSPVGAGAHGLRLPATTTRRLLLYQLTPLELWLFSWRPPKLQVANKVG